MIAGLKAGKPVEIRAPSPKGPKITEEDVAKWNKASELSTKHDKHLDNVQKNLDELNIMKEQFKQMQQKVENCVLQDEFKPVKNDVRILNESMEMAQQDIKNLWDEINKLKDHLNNMMYPSMDDFNTLKGRVEKLENAVASLKKAYGDLEKAMAKLRLP